MISTLARPARSDAPERLAAHNSSTIRILIGTLFLYTYTQMRPSVTRRRFVGASALASAALNLEAAPPAETPADTSAAMPAILGGAKAHPQPFPSWPVFNETEERGVLDTLRSGKWYRGTGKMVDQFQRAYADLTGARFCLGVANGTSALLTSHSISTGASSVSWLMPDCWPKTPPRGRQWS